MNRKSRRPERFIPSGIPFVTNAWGLPALAPVILLTLLVLPAPLASARSQTGTVAQQTSPITSDETESLAIEKQRNAIGQALQDASQEFGVPLPVLQGIAYVQSRWSQIIPTGPADTPPAYGVMGLRDDDWFGHSLIESSRLLGDSPDRLKLDPVANIRGAAALLRSVAEQLKAKGMIVDQQLTTWKSAIQVFSGIHDSGLAEGFALEVYRVLREGRHHQGIEIEAHPDIDLGALEGGVSKPQPLQPLSSCSCTGAGYPGAVPVGPPSAGNCEAGRDGYLYIIIHTTEGTAQSALDWFKNPSSGASAHYIIKGDGTIWEVVNDADTAYHAGNYTYNRNALGIELEGWSDGNPNFLWQTPAQLQSLAFLTTWLVSQHGMTLDRGVLIGHNQVPGPGTNKSGSCGSCSGPSEWGGCCNHHDPGAWWNWRKFTYDLGRNPTYQNIKITSQCSLLARPEPGASTVSSVWPDQRFASYDTKNGYYLLFISGEEYAQTYLGSGEYHWDAWLPSACGVVEPGTTDLDVARVFPSRLNIRDGVTSGSPVLGKTIDGKRYVATGSTATGYDGYTWYNYYLAGDTSYHTGWSSGAYLDAVSLQVSLSANPNSGPAPLTTDLVASVSGTAQGTMNYTYWWNCNDPGTSVATVKTVCGDIPTPTGGSCASNANGYKCDGVYDNPKTVTHVYAAGNYVAKVIAERGTASPAESRTSISVTTGTQHLTVSENGTGTGTVTSSPGGINCGSDCAEDYANGMDVWLYQTPYVGSSFAGWAGDCSGTGGCHLVMNSPKTVTATFNSAYYNLSVTTSGSGTGTVISSPTGINCPGDCAEVYPAQTSVQLTATPGPNSSFGGWSGDADCVDGVVLMSASRSCTATFNSTSGTPGDLTWASKQPLPEPLYGSAGVTLNGLIYSIGGSHWIVNYRYDPSANSWTRRADFPGPPGVSEGGAAAVGSTIYAPCGDLWPSTSFRIEVTGTDTWSLGPNVPTLRRGPGVVAVNGKVYVIGGSDMLGTVEVYDPSTGNWTSRTSMPTPRSFFATAVIGDKIYTFGGLDANGVRTFWVEIYDTVSDTWSSGSWMPTRRMGAVAGVLRGKIYVIGGNDNGGTGLNVIETYNPTTDSWQTMSPAPSSRWEAISGVIGDKIYVIGGAGGYGAALQTVEEGTLIPGCTSNADCNDNNSCTTDTCNTTTGVCSHSAVTCVASDQCHDAGSCIPATGLCSNPPKAGGTPCNDGVSCTMNDQCYAGACIAGPTKDADGDAHVDVACGGDDCNDADSNTWGVPTEVSGLVVAGSNPTNVSWNDQAPAIGSGRRYDLVTGVLDDLLAARGFAGAQCLAADLTSASYSDSRTPSAGAGFYYLTRAKNSCGMATYGPGRADLDTASPCP